MGLHSLGLQDIRGAFLFQIPIFSLTERPEHFRLDEIAVTDLIMLRVHGKH